MTETTELKGAVLDLQTGENPNEYIIKATKVGAYINASKGFQAKWTRQALEATTPTWKGGKCNVNHDDTEQGDIVDSWMDGDVVFMKTLVAAGLRTRIEEARAKDPNSVGVSVEATDGVVDADYNVVSARGTKVSFVFAPYEPACGPQDGCGLAGATGKHSVEEEESSNPPQGDPMPDETVPKAEYVSLQAAKAQTDADLSDTKSKLAAAETELVELRAFKTKVDNERKDAVLVKLKAHLGDEADKYKDERVCTLEKMLAAAEAVKTKLEFSGASAGKPDDKPPVDPDLAAANELLIKAGLKPLE